MKNLILLFTLFIASSTFAQTDSEDKAAILKIMKNQEKAWKEFKPRLTEGTKE